MRLPAVNLPWQAVLGCAVAIGFVAVSMDGCSSKRSIAVSVSRQGRFYDRLIPVIQSNGKSAVYVKANRLMVRRNQSSYLLSTHPKLVSAIKCAVFSDSGRSVALLTDDWIWVSRNGERAERLKKTTYASLVTAGWLSEKGDELVLVKQGSPQPISQFELYDLNRREGAKKYRIETRSRVTRIELTSDGKFVHASGPDSGAYLFDKGTGKEAKISLGGEVVCLAKINGRIMIGTHEGSILALENEKVRRLTSNLIPDGVSGILPSQKSDEVIVISGGGNILGGGHGEATLVNLSSQETSSLASSDSVIVQAEGGGENFLFLNEHGGVFFAGSKVRTRQLAFDLDYADVTLLESEYFYKGGLFTVRMGANK